MFNAGCAGVVVAFENIFLRRKFPENPFQHSGTNL
jgi:hypothetical protein